MRTSGISNVAARCVFEFLDVQKRLQLLVQSPNLKNFEKSVPLKIDNLEICPNHKIRINDFEWTIENSKIQKLTSPEDVATSEKMEEYREDLFRRIENNLEAPEFRDLLNFSQDAVTMIEQFPDQFLNRNFHLDPISEKYPNAKLRILDFLENSESEDVKSIVEKLYFPQKHLEFRRQLVISQNGRIIYRQKIGQKKSLDFWFWKLFNTIMLDRCNVEIDRLSILSWDMSNKGMKLKVRKFQFDGLFQVDFLDEKVLEEVIIRNEGPATFQNDLVKNCRHLTFSETTDYPQYMDLICELKNPFLCLKNLTEYRYNYLKDWIEFNKDGDVGRILEIQNFWPHSMSPTGIRVLDGRIPSRPNAIECYKVSSFNNKETVVYKVRETGGVRDYYVEIMEKGSFVVEDLENILFGEDPEMNFLDYDPLRMLEALHRRAL